VSEPTVPEVFDAILAFLDKKIEQRLNWGNLDAEAHRFLNETRRTRDKVEWAAQDWKRENGHT
jgi:hypothetical protein